ncbi:TusE/DsrC/DsvC family sulfur relay protein [Rhodoblastus acidophilus]|uniref:TusE/DsrC/DsvC family sulfur relay protein n=1 Tax=Candidatus Rhodoblastus alkanivorans TaxID=2954117 RepID=A0ABS9Z691_9HYPH|nr:TusE/DsrC/DsvC family sulfur relay protein [Candidatus Rhodoblastus alkanivorans]MCI4679192.1 TusE/DsrC/DsvC family sulfur relay protein [Candidatus Rhodoblastus alkanivorans]MCI4683188.1 TusE/DsrC/DsvC family sulfur relay protein [Candidatus Rhodoblastus alkanivorans]MDI4640500.1 TusE/DsrC/DsvC family sulfur relay protein [Rhodoblastus acidophilus]
MNWRSNTLELVLQHYRLEFRKIFEYDDLNLAIWPIEEPDMDLPKRDGDGYLLDMDAWTPEIGKAMAEADGFEMTDQKWEQVLKAREYFDDAQSVPPIRKFASYIGMANKDLFELWQTGPMKPITKYGGLPKPTGCV